MATNILNDLDSQLASLNQLKPPGASKGKIQSITQLCVNNIQAESNIVQSLYRALKKAPATHKLGAIYVIDSVVRRWIEQAKNNGQELNIEGRGEPGTYPAAVKRVTELMPALWDDTLKSVPAEQREKLEGMMKIWEKGNTFPSKMLSDFRTKLSGATNQSAVQTNGAVPASKKPAGEKFSAPVPSRPLHTPTGYPPQHLYDQGFIPRKPEQAQTNGTPAAHNQPSQQPPAPAQQPAQAQSGSDVNSILAALASSAQANAQKPTPQPAAAQSAPPQQNAQMQLPPGIAALFGQQNGMPPMPAMPAPQQQQQQQQQPPSYQMQQVQQPFQLPPGFPSMPPQPPPSVPQHYAQAPPPPQQPPLPPQQQGDPLGPIRSILPLSIQNDQDKLVRALQLLQDLQKDGIPMQEWGPVLEAFDEQNKLPTQRGYGGHDGYGQGRGRSRSPQRGGGRGRASPVYGTYEEMATRKQPEYDGFNRGGNDGGQRRYRQRSPMRDSPAPPPGSGLAMNGNPMQPKYISIDNNLPHDSIKVLSRTLFVGGANGTQQEIQQLFERFGRVQTCIANRDKRHAFVKMTTRNHALKAKEGMERLQSANDPNVMNIARQTKWGVGFGPRECCDYKQGESIIPIHKLTDADMKWLLTAEYGGTGGRKVEGGMELEEPDIEIGAGVSSKAMSKRVLPENAVQSGGSSSKRQRDDGGQHRERKRHNDGGFGGGYGGYSGVTGGPPPMQMEHYGYAKPEPVAVATPPTVPSFGGFALPGSGQPSYR